ncbi:MAG: amidohydrolase family protein, partial [Actinobacteria bacterium]|nr:amidohydrolase family protein [Actinomycetota bacterium]
MPADLVMTGAHIWGRCTGAIGIGDGHIVEPQIGPRTEVIDATGMTVVPGFQDAHVHTPFAGLNLLRVWLNDADSREEYLEIIAEHAAAHPEAQWITGGGWSMPQFPGGTPRKEDV